jgi:predicted peroxiredoxin
VVNLTAGTDDVHRAALGLAFAQSALGTGRDVTVFMNVDAVELANRELPESLRFWEFPPISQMLPIFWPTEGGCSFVECV